MIHGSQGINGYGLVVGGYLTLTTGIPLQKSGRCSLTSGLSTRTLVLLSIVCNYVRQVHSHQYFFEREYCFTTFITFVQLLTSTTCILEFESGSGEMKGET